MSVQKNIKLQIHRGQNFRPSCSSVSIPAHSEINIQVADGWVITGHYCDQTLQAVTLRKKTDIRTN
jgi:hypothetical protein